MQRACFVLVPRYRNTLNPFASTLPCVDANVVLCVAEFALTTTTGTSEKGVLKSTRFSTTALAPRHDHQPAGLYMGYGKLRQKHGLAVSIGSLLRHRDGGSAYVSQKSPDPSTVASRVASCSFRPATTPNAVLCRSDAGRQLTGFRGFATAALSR